MSYWRRFLGARSGRRFASAGRGLTQASGDGPASISGVQGSGAAGTLTADGEDGGSSPSVSIVGVSSTGYVADLLGASISVPITGASGTAGAGLILADGTAAPNTTLTGVSASGAAGTISASGGQQATPSITGVEGVGAPGSLIADSGGSAVVTLLGVSGSGSAGTIAAETEARPAITGVSATGGVGILSFVETSPVERINITIKGQRAAITVRG